MKKTEIVLLTLSAAFAAWSCQKELPQPAEGPTAMVINAVSEGIGTDPKAEMAYRYDLLWQSGDKILVKNSTESATFTLTGGAGTTNGTFSGTTSISGEVEAFYPESVASGTELVWPSVQTADQAIPMYCTNTISGAAGQTFNFKTLGAVYQLVFSTASAGVVLSSIEVSANEAMSGAFMVSDGRAIISQPEGFKPGIALDLGEAGVALGVTAKYFTVAIPSGTYTDLTFVFRAKDGRTAKKHATKAQVIGYNTVSRLTTSGTFGTVDVSGVELDKETVEITDGEVETIKLNAMVLPVDASNRSVTWTSSNPSVATVDNEGNVTFLSAGTTSITVTTADGSFFKSCDVTVKGSGPEPLPDGALSGVFTIDANGKKVNFSKGNLQATYNGSGYTFGFAENQYDIIGWAAGNTTIDSQADGSVVDLFGFSTDSGTKPWGINTSVSESDYSGNFKDWGENIGDGKTWRTLSKDEWTYLLFSRSVNGGTGEGKSFKVFVINRPVGQALHGLVLYPDGYSSSNTKSRMPSTIPMPGEEDIQLTTSQWMAMEADGCVFLPASGERYRGTDLIACTSYAFYWTSTTASSTTAYLWCNVSGGEGGKVEETNRHLGHSVRLVTDSK